MATESKIFLMMALIGAIEVALYMTQIQGAVHRGTRLLLPLWQQMYQRVRNALVGRASSRKRVSLPAAPGAEVRTSAPDPA